MIGTTVARRPDSQILGVQGSEADPNDFQILPQFMQKLQSQFIVSGHITKTLM